jgi:hypothetical protein
MGDGLKPLTMRMGNSTTALPTLAMISSTSKNAPRSTRASAPAPVMYPLSFRTGSYSSSAGIEVAKVTTNNTPAINAILRSAAFGGVSRSSVAGGDSIVEGIGIPLLM